jgi:hypothetical protein
MSIERLISTKEIDLYIRTEIAELLLTNDIYELGHYGWSGIDTVDDDLVGHAMWQTEPPVHWDFRGLTLRSVPQQLEPWQEILALSGADFEGTMDAARLSIGLTLFQENLISSNEFADRSFFWLHHMASMFSLATASDRIRDFFIAGMFRKASKEYQNGSYCRQKRSWYTTPFVEAADVFQDATKWTIEALGELLGLVDRVKAFRDQRNEIVHEIASQLGRLEREILERNRVTPKIEYDSVSQLSSKAIAAEHQKELSAALDKSKEWYKLLVQTSNLVFIAEHEQRRPARPTA